MKKLVFLIAALLLPLSGFAQCNAKGYENWQVIWSDSGGGHIDVRYKKEPWPSGGIIWFWQFRHNFVDEIRFDYRRKMAGGKWYNTSGDLKSGECGAGDWTPLDPDIEILSVKVKNQLTG